MRDITNNDRLVHVHIPKTAGSSFRRQIKKHYRMRSVHHDGPYNDYFGFFRDRLSELRPTLESTTGYVVSGHYRFRDLIEPLGSLLPNLTLLTHLREPVERMVSDYFYSISEAHPEHAEVLVEFPTFESYFQHHGHINKQLDYLRPHEDATLAETIASIEEHFSFVGLTEMYDECGAVLFERLGCSQPQEMWVNENLNKDKVSAATIEYRPALLELLGDELELYNHFRSQWEAALAP